MRLCRVHAFRYSSVLYLTAAHFDRPSAEQHAETLFRKQRDERINQES